MSIQVNNFLDNDDNIRPDLLDKEAHDIAREFSRKKLSTHQVRKFYDEVKHYKERIDRGESFKKLFPLIVMLKSKAKYASTKKSEMSIFYDFIDQSVKKIKNEDEEKQKKNFYAFCLFFEAVYGFAELKK
jgi:CRISPR type III-A-associated protein Csm2